MIVFPTMYIVERGIHLFISLTIGLLQAKTFKLNVKIIILTMLLVIPCAIYFIVGVIRGNDVTSAIPLYLVWPFFFMMAVHFRINQKELLTFEKTVIIATVGTCFFVIIGVTWILTFGKNYFFEFVYPISIGYVNGNPKFGSQFLPILCFAIPFTLIASLNRSRIVQILYLLASIFMTIFSIVSGRSVFLLCILMLPIYLFLNYFFVRRTVKRKIVKTLIAIFLVFSLVSVLFSDQISIALEIFIEKLLGIDNSVTNSGRRLEQFNHIISAISVRPYGSGINAPEYPGSDVVAFEVTYLQILHNFGIFISLVFIVINASLFIMVWSFFRKRGDLNIISPWLFGYINYMICSASNPILLKFDRLWILWIPLFLYANRKLLTDEK